MRCCGEWPAAGRPGALTRIVSLLPAGTEIVCALGAGDSLVGVSHECDYPAMIAGLPRVTATPIDQARPGSEIDAEVRRLRAAGVPVIGVDADQLEALAPDLILTQDLCQVCAVSDGEVHQLARAMSPAPRMLSLRARDLKGIWRDIQETGAALGRQSEASDLVAARQKQLARISDDHAADRPRVVCVEWLEPVFLAGHWVPELIDAAGGLDVGAVAGSHSVVTTGEKVLALNPDLLIIAICGFGLDRAFEELADLADDHWIRTFPGPVWVLDGNAYTSRPGPRVVEAAELIQSALRGIERPGSARYTRGSADFADDTESQQPSTEAVVTTSTNRPKQESTLSAESA